MEQRATYRKMDKLKLDLEELERRHFLVMKDFNKLQDERMCLLREKETLEEGVELMSDKLEEIIG